MFRTDRWTHHTKLINPIFIYAAQHGVITNSCKQLEVYCFVASFPVSTPSFFSQLFLQHAEKKLGVETGNEATVLNTNRSWDCASQSILKQHPIAK